MNRALVLVGGLAAVGLAFATAGWEPFPVTHGGDVSRRGRLEFRHEASPVRAGESVPAAGGTPEVPEQPAAQPEVPEVPAEQPAAATQPETPVEPPPEPQIESITTVELSVVENAELPLFKLANSVRIEIDSEGIIFWVTSSNRTEMGSQKHIFNNIGPWMDRPFLIIPDRYTAWQYVKDTLATADQAGMQKVYLGVADIENKTTLRLLRVMTSAPSDEAKEGDFVIHVEERDDAMVVSVDGQEIESFPTDLAIAWADYKKAHPDADVSFSPNSAVVVDAHRFTPTAYVAQVVGVLRGLGIQAERFVGSTTYGGRKRK